MSTFEVLVRKIDDIYDHPNADRLSIVKIMGYEAITNKDEEGNHRFTVGEPIVYVPEAAVIPEDVLKEQGFWDEAKGKGMLSGSKGDRVKAVRLRQHLSQGLVWKVHDDLAFQPYVARQNRSIIDGDLIESTTTRWVEAGDDVADFFGITKYEPPIPAGMGGEVLSAAEFMLNFDIENWQNFPTFLEGDEVEAVEKGHGTFTRISYRPGVNNPELFGNGDVAIASKGLGAKGLVFKNNEKNANNLYVRVANELSLIDKVRSVGSGLGVAIDLMGETFGPGVQWLHYGQSKPTFKAFDIRINGAYLGADEKAKLFEILDIERLPVLYRGPWDVDALIAVRDGQSVIGGDHIREGVVVTVVGDQSKRKIDGYDLRPFLKMVSPAYLNKTTGDEFN